MRRFSAVVAVVVAVLTCTSLVAGATFKAIPFSVKMQTVKLTVEKTDVKTVSTALIALDSIKTVNSKGQPGSPVKIIKQVGNVAIKNKSYYFIFYTATIATPDKPTPEQVKASKAGKMTITIAGKFNITTKEMTFNSKSLVGKVSSTNCKKYWKAWTK